MTRRVAVAALLLAAACSRPEADLGAAVRAYDDALVRAYSRGDAALLTGLATAKEQGRVQVLVDLKSAGKLALESRIESFEVTKATVAGDAGAVETRERWRYHDRNLKPGGADGPEFVADMRMAYDLVREDGRWKVQSVRTISNAYLNPTGPAGPSGP
ncbi:MAG TPA: hypothetical protein VFM45_09180 [Anaeromyxobacteraceae bacterium]|nr:hypothetical protein [Anaeromyxobacteraceae bacterium]